MHTDWYDYSNCPKIWIPILLTKWHIQIVLTKIRLTLKRVYIPCHFTKYLVKQTLVKETFWQFKYQKCGILEHLSYKQFACLKIALVMTWLKTLQEIIEQNCTKKKTDKNCTFYTSRMTREILEQLYAAGILLHTP